MLQATTAYLDGTDDGTLLAEAQYETRVYIEKIRLATLGYYNDYVDSLNEDTQARFLPYYMKTYDPEGEVAICSIIVKVLFIIGLIPLLLILSGICQKDVHKYLKKNPSPSVARAKLDNFLDTTTESNGLRFNRDFLCGTYGCFTVFIETSQIARVYTENHTLTYAHNIPIKEKIVIIGLKNGTKQPVAVRNLETAKKQLKELQLLCPWIAVGFFPRHI